jgi:uncharacterized LabA/DUF88 family protein
MLFVDGENFTIRAQELASANSLQLTEGSLFQRDVFIWLPNVKPTAALVNNENTPIHVQPHAIRAHYYTSVFGDDQKVASVRLALWSLGFNAEVFKRSRKDQKAKGVDIALTKDLLAHAFLDNFDVAVLFTADGDYVPVVEEIKRRGKIVYVCAFAQYGLSQDLRLASDTFFEMEAFFLKQWLPAGEKQSVS